MKASGQLHAPAALLPGKQALVSISLELGGPQSRSERCGSQIIFLPKPGIEPQFLSHPALILKISGNNNDPKLIVKHWHKRTSSMQNINI
jgi:hypothetical protein